MNITWIVGWHAAMLLVCALAAAIWPGRFGRKVLVFLVLAVLTVGFAWIPLRRVPAFWFAFAIPLLATLIAAIRRPRTWWRIAAGVPALVLFAGLAYAGVALWTASALIPTDAVLHLSTFLAAKDAVRANLNDPDSAVFKDLQLSTYHGNRYVCGEVNARNRMGGLAGFTRFFVRADDVIPFPTFNPSDDTAGFDTYMRTCYGDNWQKP